MSKTQHKPAARRAKTTSVGQIRPSPVAHGDWRVDGGRLVDGVKPTETAPADKASKTPSTKE